MNSNLEQAIHQAMAELDRQATSAVECKETINSEKLLKQVKIKQKK